MFKSFSVPQQVYYQESKEETLRETRGSVPPPLAAHDELDSLLSDLNNSRYSSIKGNDSLGYDLKKSRYSFIKGNESLIFDLYNSRYSSIKVNDSFLSDLNNSGYSSIKGTISIL